MHNDLNSFADTRKEISICMTHFNRKKQLLNTLNSIQRQQNAKELTEIIIVDDVSDTPLTYDDLKYLDLDIKLITIDTKNKWWINPSVAFNIAFSLIHGKRAIIQNAECLHKTDIIDYVMKNLNTNDYIAMSALALTKKSSDDINFDSNIDSIDTNESIWHCHSIHRPEALNFCTALFTEDLIKIGGFDMNFAEGIWFDDNFFLDKIKRNGMRVKIEDSQLVYHQWHEDSWVKNNDFHFLKNKNEIIYKTISQ